jgi:hypothetical protein
MCERDVCSVCVNVCLVCVYVCGKSCVWCAIM